MREKGWQIALSAYISECKRSSFEPGKLDCALFAAGAVKAMTGKDLAKGYRGYKSLHGGFRKLREKGFADHIELAAAHLEECGPAFARAGDLAVVDGDDGEAIGIVQGRFVYVMTPGGVGLVSRSKIKKAFRV